MKEHILQYYTNEKQGAGWGIALGILFIAVAVGLWRAACSMSLQRGLGYTLLSTGALIVLVTVSAVIYNNRSILHTKEMAVASNADLQRSEVSRMEKVMARSYIGGWVTFSVAAVVGFGLLMLGQKQFMKGIGLGLVLFGLLGISAELFSMKRNRHYLEEIRQLKF